MHDDTRRGYRPEIDGLRGIAVLMVILFHAKFPFFGGGYIGVDIFFVISGYLITKILLSDPEPTLKSIAYFYERRARRILPALFVMSVICSALAWSLLAPPALMEFAGHLLGSSLFVANVVYFLQSGYFATESEHLPLIHTWSLAIEEQFYLVFPPLLFLLTRLSSVARISVLSSLALLSLAAAHVLSSNTETADAAFFLLPTRSWELLAGAIVAYIEERRPFRHAIGSKNASAFGMLGLAMCLVPSFVFDKTIIHPSLYTAVPVIGVCLIIAFGNANSTAGRLLSLPPLVGIGLISYSVYLFHQPILAFGRIAFARELMPSEAALAIIASLILGALSWKWVEQPFRRQDRFTQPTIAIGAAAALIGPAAIGCVILINAGFPSRMDGAVTATLEALRSGWKFRAVGIRLGPCHYNSSIVPDFEKFLEFWDCLPSDTPRILVVGDSVSADKAWLLREAGFAVGNIGGAGCGLIPPNNAAEPCSRIHAKARQLVRDQNVSGIILGNNWTKPVPKSELDKLIVYWSELRVPILIFSGMPNFSDLRNRIVKNIRDGIPLESISFDEAAFAAHLASLAPLRAAGFEIIDSRALLCGKSIGNCGAFLHGKALVIDPIHLQPTGIRVMAERLRKETTWLNWYRRVARSPRSRPGEQ